MKQAVMVSMSSYNKIHHNCFCNTYERSGNVVVLLNVCKRMATINVVNKISTKFCLVHSLDVCLINL